MKDTKAKKTKKSAKKKSNLSNKKHLNNKTLKARYILEKNLAAQKRSEEAEKAPALSKARRVMRIVKNTVLGVFLAVIVVVLISTVTVKIRGGTPTVFGYSIQRISSGSMEPALDVGDIILSKEVTDASQISVDDIITYQGGVEFDYNSVTHRVVEGPNDIGDGRYLIITKGDANADVDPEIFLTDVKSVYINKIDFLVDFYNFFLSPWGLLIFIAALMIIFFDEMLTVGKVITGNYEDDEEDLKDIMDRLKREEEEAQQRAEEEKARRRNNRKYDSTSAKKKRARNKQRELEQKKQRQLESAAGGSGGSKPPHKKSNKPKSKNKKSSKKKR